MKFLLKFILSLVVLLTGIYASTPLWLPYVIAGQLPQGWQLAMLESGYPDLSGVRIHRVHLKGNIPAADLVVSATDLLFSFRGLKTDVDALALDVYWRDSESRSFDALRWDDLSLPITRLTGKWPQLSVRQAQLVIHPSANGSTDLQHGIEPLVLLIESFKLSPSLDGSFHVNSQMSFEKFPHVNGQANVDVSTKSLKAEIRFPADTDSAPWLAVLIEQNTHSMNAETRIKATFDANTADPKWLDPILVTVSDGWIEHASGKLEAQADFAGQDLQNMAGLTLTTQDLQLFAVNESLQIRAELLASRQDQSVIVNLPIPAKIEYRDEAGRIERLLTSLVAGLHRAPRSSANIDMTIGSGSNFLIKPGSSAFVGFNGNISATLTSNDEIIEMQTNDIHVEMGQYPELSSVEANGLIKVDWAENTPLSYRTNDLELSANRLSGSALFTAAEDVLTSTGNATIMAGHIASPAISAQTLDLAWQEFDLLNMAGKLTTQTQGLSARLNDETWSGFNLDVTYELLSNADIRGSGAVVMVDGPQLPVEFSGNATSSRWGIVFPSTTLNLTQLGALLATAHLALPESVTLGDGYVDLQASVDIDDLITASLDIEGYQVAASMLESSARQASFSFTGMYDQTMSASGPVAIESITLAGGIDVADIEAQLALEDSDTVVLQNLQAALFDGHLQLDTLRYTANRIEDTTVELSHINLGSLLEFADIDGLNGTGTLEISLPTGSDQTGIYIKNGTFKSSIPGYISYSHGAAAGSNIGLQALENFQYKDLSGVINYQSDGGYQVTVHLDGRNPDLYDGYPVVFNLNINGSLPELFDALFITGDFETAIINTIKEQ